MSQSDWRFVSSMFWVFLLLSPLLYMALKGSEIIAQNERLCKKYGGEYIRGVEGYGRSYKCVIDGKVIEDKLLHQRDKP